MPVLSLRRDPYWDLDGRSARRERILRRVLVLIVAILAAALLAMTIGRLTTIDAHALMTGHRTALIGALLADVAACLLLVAGRLRLPLDA